MIHSRYDIYTGCLFKVGRYFRSVLSTRQNEQNSLYKQMCKEQF